MSSKPLTKGKQDGKKRHEQQLQHRVCGAITQLMAKSPEGRPQHANAVAHELHAILEELQAES